MGEGRTKVASEIESEAREGRQGPGRKKMGYETGEDDQAKETIGG